MRIHFRINKSAILVMKKRKEKKRKEKKRETTQGRELHNQ